MRIPRDRKVHAKKGGKAQGVRARQSAKRIGPIKSHSGSCSGNSVQDGWLYGGLFRSSLLADDAEMTFWDFVRCSLMADGALVTIRLLLLCFSSANF